MCDAAKGCAMYSVVVAPRSEGLTGLNMKIIVFGANGRTGKLIVHQALAKGHAVTAYVRNADGLPQDPHLRLIEGDVNDFGAVVSAVRGHRAVLSALGANSRKKSEVLAHAIPHIIEGMRQEYVNRLIVLGAAGVDPEWGKYQNGFTRIGLWLAKHTALRHPFVDQLTQERLIAASDLDYTIVRAPRLGDGPFTGAYRVLPDALPSGATRINRADVADFMLQQLTDPRFHRQGPYIGCSTD
jgi:putative NADH-flavin reductase